MEMNRLQERSPELMTERDKLVKKRIKRDVRCISDMKDKYQIPPFSDS